MGRAAIKKRKEDAKAKKRVRIDSAPGSRANSPPPEPDDDLAVSTAGEPEIEPEVVIQKSGKIKKNLAKQKATDLATTRTSNRSTRSLAAHSAPAPDAALAPASAPLDENLPKPRPTRKAAVKCKTFMDDVLEDDTQESVEAGVGNGGSLGHGELDERKESRHNGDAREPPIAMWEIGGGLRGWEARNEEDELEYEEEHWEEHGGTEQGERDTEDGGSDEEVTEAGEDSDDTVELIGVVAPAVTREGRGNKGGTITPAQRSALKKHEQPVKTKPLLAKSTGRGVKPARKASPVVDSESDSEDETFNFTIEISDTTNGTCARKILPSNMPWIKLQKKLSQLFNVFPTSLKAQYRFSTERGSLPCDLASQDDLDTLFTLLKPLIVPPRLANGRPSGRKMKAVYVKFFSQGDDPDAVVERGGKSGPGKKPTGGKPLLVAQAPAEDKPKLMAERTHEQRVKIRQEIIDAFNCAIHSLPNKPVVCWKDALGQCHVITESNLNIWSSLCIQDPGKYTPEVKPEQVHTDGIRRKNPGHHLGHGYGEPGHYPGHAMAPPVGYGYGYLPPPPNYLPHPNYPPPSWYQPPPATMGASVTPQPQPPLEASAQADGDVVYPEIVDWLKYCDRHPGRRGSDFSSLTLKFVEQGYRHIDQITKDRINVKQLADWIEIGTGTADLLITYATKDVALVNVGKLTMAAVLADG